MSWLSFLKNYFIKTYHAAKDIRHAKWLGFLAPYLHHPRLWHLHKKGVALGVAIGIFFGFLIPIAQAPLSIVSSVLLRAHIPVAVVSTLVTNPVTFAPVYYAAYKVGDTLRGKTEQSAQSTPPKNSFDPPKEEPSGAMDKTKSLALGLSLFALVGSSLSYCIIYYGWILFILQKRKKRIAKYAHSKTPT